MAKVTRASIGYGSVEYRKEVEAVPKSSKTTGNVTVNNMGSLGLPAHYKVNFYIGFDLQAEEIQENSYVSISVPLVGKSAEASYGEVEASAALQLPSLLRDLAAELEKQIGEKKELESSGGTV
jgi:hypothetical protein